MNSAVIYNSEGQIEMIVHPDFEAQLDDPAFNPKGCTHVRILRSEYDKCSSDMDIHQKVVESSKDVTLVPMLTQKIADYKAKVLAEEQFVIVQKIAFDATVAEFEKETGLIYDLNDSTAFDSWQAAAAITTL